MFQVKPLSQMDPSWKNTLLGLDQTSTIGKYGCLLTSMTMVANGFGANETPASMNDKMKAVSGFIDDLVIPGAMPAAIPQVRFSKRVQCNNPPAPIGEIDAALGAGLPVIVKVDYAPVSGIQDHWIVLLDKQGDDYLIQDPWPYPAETGPVLLTKRYGFAGSPDHIILDTLFYTGSAQPAKPAPPANPKPLPANALVIYAIADGLAVRTQPLVNDQTLIERIGMGSKLIVLEDAAGARAKVGQQNNWLNVQVDGDGQQGMVAAWYVSLNAQEVPQVPVQNPPATPPADPAKPSGLVVYAATDGLAVRTQNVISPATLLKRVPLNTQFVSQETDAQTIAKIGVDGQWLSVQDVGGTHGMVAAWYIALKPQDPTLGVTPVPPTPAVPVAPPAPKPGAALTVRTTDEGVALRSTAVISPSTLIKRFAIGADLVVLEDPAQASAKIGVVNQWINVRDISGSVGYIAAWYVVKSPLPAGTANIT